VARYSIVALGQGNRGGSSRAFASFASLNWEGLASLVFPLGVNPGYDVNWEMNLFIGLPLLALGLFGLCGLRDRNVRALLGVFIIGLLVALGANTPFFEVFYRYLPGYSMLRVHSRAGVLVVFALVCAAGVWLSRPHPHLRSLIAANFGLPVRYLVVLVIGFHLLLLLYGTWTIKAAYAFSKIAGQSADYPLQYTVMAVTGTWALPGSLAEDLPGRDKPEPWGVGCVLL